MRKIILFTLVVLFFYNSYSQETKDDINYLGRNNSESYSNNTINVNDASTHHQFQDVKRGVCIFHFPKRPGKPGHKLISTGTIINTNKNSYTEYGDRTTLLLCAVHNLIGHDFTLKESVPKVGDDLIFYMSFDNETSLNKETNEGYHFYIQELSEILIHRLWKTNVKVLVLDLESDLALLEVKFGREDGEPSLEQHLAFLNTYAIGWTVHPDLSNDKFTNISHPRGDHKKIYQDSQFPLHETNQNYYLKRDVPNRFVFAADLTLQLNNERWGNRADKIHVGASGSSLLTSSGLSIGILSSLESYSLLENSWTLSADNSVPDLSRYLDPDETWISSVPGGYLKELIPNNPNANNYNVEVNSDHPISQTVALDGIDFFRLLEPPITATTSSIILGEGILPAESNSGEVIMYVTPASRPDNLLYGAMYTHNHISVIATKFKGFSWGAGRNPFNIPNFPTNENYSSKSIKNSVLNHMSNVSDEQGEVIEISDFNFNATINLQAKAGAASVRAIKLPNMMPFNAVELFEAERLDNMWKSYHYKPSRGENSDEYHIESVKVELEQYVPVPDQTECVLLPKKTLREITTKNNGGYLNLKNPHFQIKNIVASHESCPQNKLFVTIATKDSELLVQTYYGAWLDYYQDKKEGDNPNPEDDYTYNFMDDNTIHPTEQLGVNNSIGSPGTIEHEIPYENELPFNLNGKITTSLRVAIAEQPQPGQMALTQGGIYEHGEVEDYLAEIKLTSKEDEREAARGAYPAVILVEEGNDLPVAEAVDLIPPEEELPIFNINGELAMLDYDNSNVGKNAIFFNGQTYINVAEGGNLVHDPASEKTFSIDFLIQSIDGTEDEILFEEGGGENGFSLRLKDGKIKYGVKIEDQLAVIETSSTLSAGQMTNITAVFNEGVLKLYLNGVLEATDDQSFSAGTNIPQHLDDAGIGGTVGTNIWGDDGSIDYFNGIVDYFEYWNEALAASIIGILATRVTTANNNARVATTPSEGEAAEPKEGEETAPYFSVFPNPATDVLNILVEIQRPGALSIVISDLSGRKVYETDRPNISPGHQLITLKTPDIALGEYIISIHAGNVKESTRIIFE